jgi:hypothetical protein
MQADFGKCRFFGAKALDVQAFGPARPESTQQITQTNV